MHNISQILGESLKEEKAEANAISSPEKINKKQRSYIKHGKNPAKSAKSGGLDKKTHQCWRKSLGTVNILLLHEGGERMHFLKLK